MALPATLRRWIEQTPGWRFGVGLGIGAYLVARIPHAFSEPGPTILLLLTIALSVIGASIPGSGFVLAAVLVVQTGIALDSNSHVLALLDVRFLEPIHALTLTLSVLMRFSPLYLALIAMLDDVRRWRGREPLWPRLPFALGGDRPPRPYRPDWESGLLLVSAFYAVTKCLLLILSSFMLYELNRAFPSSALSFGGIAVTSICVALGAILLVQRWAWAPWFMLCALAGKQVVWRLVFTQEHLNYQTVDWVLGSQTIWDTAAYGLHVAFMAMICVREFLRLDPGGLVAALRKVL